MLATYAFIILQSVFGFFVGLCVGVCFFLPQKKAIRKLKAVTRTFLNAVSKANMTQIPVAISEVIKKSSRLESMKGFTLLKKHLRI